jgi:ParB family chromosome partitioning protein
MRLVDLPAPVRALIADGRLQMGHARALIGFDGAEELAQKIVAEGLSVRAVEAIVKKAKKPASIEYKSMPERGSNASLAICLG